MKGAWVLGHGVLVAAGSLALAVFSGNQNWPFNIPCGLVVGAVYGYVTWPIFDRLVRWARREGRRDG